MKIRSKSFYDPNRDEWETREATPEEVAAGDAYNARLAGLRREPARPEVLVDNNPDLMPTELSARLAYERGRKWAIYNGATVINSKEV